MNIFKWTSADGKRIMANLHESLNSTCKSRISKISTRCHILGGSIPQLLILNSEMNLKILQSGGSIPQLLILNSEMNLKILQSGGSIPQLLILNSEMNLKIFPIRGSIPQLLILNSEMKGLY